jgi:hypothetical protein
MPKNHQLAAARDRVLSAFPQFAHMYVQEFRQHASEVTPSALIIAGDIEHMCLDAFQSTQPGYVGGDV